MTISAGKIRSFVVALVAGSSLAACASMPEVTLDQPAEEVFAGGTVAQGPTSSVEYYPMTAGAASLGLAGMALTASHQSTVRGFNLADPADLIARSVQEGIAGIAGETGEGGESRYSVSVAVPEWGSIYYSFAWDRFYVYLRGNIQVIDTVGGEVLASYSCGRLQSHDEPSNSPSHDDLMLDGGELLGQLTAGLVSTCVDKFFVEALNTDAPGLCLECGEAEALRLQGGGAD